MTELLAAIEAPLGRTVDRFVRDHHLPGATAGLVIDGRLAWSHSVSLADQDTGRAIDVRTLFRIASVTKTFTSTAILRLRDQGRLHLDDPLVRYLPELEGATNPHGRIEGVTIRRVLTHTSGLANTQGWVGALPAYPCEPTDLATTLAHPEIVEVRYPPGSRFEYSNIGFDLLGVLIERLGGMPMEACIERWVCEPLGMTATCFVPEGDLAARRARGHDPHTYEERLTPARALSPAWTTAAGGLWSCVEDLARYVAFHLAAHRPGADAGADAEAGAAVLAPASRREMHRLTVVSADDLSRARGLGWGAVKRGDSIVVAHTGGVPGFSALVALLPGDGIGAVVLYNGKTKDYASGPFDIGLDLLDLVAPVVRDEAERRALERPLAGPPPTQDTWRDLLGTYIDGEIGYGYRAEVRGGSLVLVPVPVVPGEPVARLVATDEPDVFTIAEDEGLTPHRVVFVRDDDGTVVRMAHGWDGLARVTR